MIFLTGGTGFLGHHLVAALCRQGVPVRLLSRTPNAYPWLVNYPNVTVVQGDLRDYDAVLAGMQGCDRVIHAAGLFSMWQDAGDFIATNVLGTQNVINAARVCGVKRLVYVSTVAVIGKPQPGRIIDEQHPPNPSDLYQASKLEAEREILSSADATLSTVVVRPGAFYGPMGTYAFNRLFFIDPMRGLIMQMDGGKYIIFPAYIGDVAQGILLALAKGQTGEIYNLCGETLSHRAAFDIICEEAGIRWPRLTIPGWVGINFARLLTFISKITRREPFYPVGLRSYVFNDWVVSSDKAIDELGFQPTPFRDGARHTIAWFKAGKPDTIPEVVCDPSD